MIKLPFKIVWRNRLRQPVTITVTELSNGYVVGDTFIATKEKLIENLIAYIQEPHAHRSAPIYNDNEL